VRVVRHPSIPIKGEGVIVEVCVRRKETHVGDASVGDEARYVASVDDKILA
jgi:hypothetical protein